jgi:hypothetical protein
MGVPNGGPKWGSQMGVPNGGPIWGSQMGVPNGGPKWGSQMGVLNGGLKWESKSGSSVSKCQNIKMIKWPNDQMAKWPKGAIEGVNVHKVIPRPTALRAVGKKVKRNFLLHWKLRLTYSEKRKTLKKIWRFNTFLLLSL